MDPQGEGSVWILKVRVVHMDSQGEGSGMDPQGEGSMRVAWILKVRVA